VTTNQIRRPGHQPDEGRVNTAERLPDWPAVFFWDGQAWILHRPENHRKK